MSICSHQYFHSIVRAFLSGANLLTWSIFLRSWSLRRQLRLQFCQSLAAGVKISHTSKNNHRTYFRWWFVCSPVLLFRKQMLAKMWQKKTSNHPGIQRPKLWSSYKFGGRNSDCRTCIEKNGFRWSLLVHLYQNRRETSLSLSQGLFLGNCWTSCMEKVRSCPTDHKKSTTDPRGGWPNNVTFALTFCSREKDSASNCWCRCDLAHQPWPTNST